MPTSELDRLIAVTAAYGTGGADSLDVARTAREFLPALRRAAHAERASLTQRGETLEEAAKVCETQMFLGLPVDAHRRGFFTAREKCAAAIRALKPTASPCEASVHPAWIPATERLPKIWEEVLVCHVLGDRDRCPRGYDVAALKSYDPEEWVFPWDRTDQNPPPQWVTHWMPLPAPPDGPDGPTEGEKT